MTTILGLSGFALAGKKNLKGHVRVDGSSTVFPITEAMAEEFQKENRRVRVTVGISGTGGGFKKFLLGETDINDASRKIKGSEAEKARKKGIHYVELPVAYDGISVVVSRKNKFLKSITTDELKKLWSPGSKITTWRQLNPKYPDAKIRLYGPGPDSGTFDYFTKKVNGKERASRSDYTASEDDNVLISGIADDPNALGYFGYAYYAENKNKLRALSIDEGKGGVEPTPETIETAAYPLARPVFIYVSRKAAARPEVAEFVRFYLKMAPTIVLQVGYTPLSAEMYKEAIGRFENLRLGSLEQTSGSVKG